MTDWEGLYKLASSIDEIAMCTIYGMAFAWFCMPFLKQKKHALISGGAFSAVLALLWVIPVEVGNFTVYSLSMLAGLFALCLLEPKRRRQKSFLAVTFFSVRWLAMAIGNCLYIWLDKINLKIPHFTENQELQFRFFLFNIALNDLVDFVLLFGVSWIIGKVYRYKNEEMNRNEFLLMLLPSLSGLVGYAMMKNYDNNYKVDTGYDLSEISTQFNLMCLCYYVVSLVTIIVLIILYQGIKEKQEETKRRELLDSQIESMKHHISKVEHLYMDIRGLRHDMGNHITTLEALYEIGKNVAAGEYMAELKQKLWMADNEVKSGNPVTDVILSERKQEAQEEGIEFVCNFHYPKSERINAFDMSVILNNALDNAVKAAKGVVKRGRCPQIQVRSYAKGEVYMLEIENDFAEDGGEDEIEGIGKPERGGKAEKAANAEREERAEGTGKAERVDNVERKRKAGKVERVEKEERSERAEKEERTGKAERAEKEEKAGKAERAEKEKRAGKAEGVGKSEKAEITEKINEESHHGYGLINIKKVAQKYCGDMLVERTDGVFKLSVMLVQ